MKPQRTRLPGARHSTVSRPITQTTSSCCGCFHSSFRLGSRQISEARTAAPVDPGHGLLPGTLIGNRTRVGAGGEPASRTANTSRRWDRVASMGLDPLPVQAPSPSGSARARPRCWHLLGQSCDGSHARRMAGSRSSPLETSRGCATTCGATRRVPVEISRRSVRKAGSGSAVGRQRNGCRSSTTGRTPGVRWRESLRGVGY